jgi:ADP-heptose:LPS heptosyltransferase
VRHADALARQYIPPGSIAVVPTSGHVSKDWPAETLQATVDVLTRDLGRHVVRIGHIRKNPAIRSMTDLTGKSSFLTDAYLLRYSGLFDVTVGVDTGMMQIAGCVSSDANGSYENARGNRTVSLFGPTDAATYRPYDPTAGQRNGSFNLVVEPNVRSSAMRAVGWARDLSERRYMREIRSCEIVEKIEQQLAAGRAALPPPSRPGAGKISPAGDFCR